MFQQVNILSGAQTGPGRCGPRIQECWSFEHPRRDMILDPRGESVASRHSVFELTQAFAGVPYTNSHNTRAAHLSFRIPTAGTLHGLAGYFEAHLYGNVGLSIHPERMSMISPDMMSWFPLYFPLKVSCKLRITDLSLIPRSTGTTLPPFRCRTRRSHLAFDR